MTVLYTVEFQKIVTQLSKKNSYRNLSECIAHFMDNKLSKLSVKSYIRLSGRKNLMLLKTDVCGRSGYRLYFFYFMEQDVFVFAFIHPKTGSEGKDNIKNKEVLYENLDSNMEDNTLCELTINSKKVVFGSTPKKIP